jgi:hypothetical protein
MVTKEQIAEARRDLGRCLADAREAVGWSQSDLAHQINYSRSTVAGAETGAGKAARSFWEECDQRLNCQGHLLTDYDRLQELTLAYRRQVELSRRRQPSRAPRPASPDVSDPYAFRQAPASAASLGGLRQQLLISPAAFVHDPDVRASTVRREARAAHEAYQRADYRAVARMLPAVIGRAEALARESTTSTGSDAAETAAIAYLAASKVAVKLGDDALAWVAADRAAHHARHAGHVDLGLAAAYSLACAQLADPHRVSDANDVALSALDDDTAPPNRSGPTRARTSLRGSLTLLLAIIAARQDRHADAENLLDQATDLASQVGSDHNDYWTAFGPTNVLIHRVGIAAAAARSADQAIGLAERLDPGRLPQVLTGRRAKVHLDLAAAFTHTPQGGAPAVLHLLEAERTAPQIFSLYPPARALVAGLLRRERRATMPGLRELAERAAIT